MKFDIGTMYAVDAGDYGGTYFVVCDNTGAHVNCVQLPDKEIVNVPVKDFTAGIEQNIVKHVADLPDGVYAYCKAIYENNNI